MNKPIKRLGLLALGETPRPGLAAVFRAVLGPGVEILERGALDGLEPPGSGTACSPGRGRSPWRPTCVRERPSESPGRASCPACWRRRTTSPGSATGSS